MSRLDHVKGIGPVYSGQCDAVADGVVIQFRVIGSDDVKALEKFGKGVHDLTHKLFGKGRMTASIDGDTLRLKGG